MFYTHIIFLILSSAKSLDEFKQNECFFYDQGD